MLCGVVLLIIAAFGAMLYYGAMLLGLYKDPLMAHFRIYGEERRMYPLPRFVLAAGLSLSLLGFQTGSVLTGTMMVVGALIILGISLVIARSQVLRSSLPRWYQHLLSITTRQERRAIAYAWVRLPLRTRLRLNGDRYAFRTFVDEVRLTVIYGARDPDDPWEQWQ